VGGRARRKYEGAPTIAIRKVRDRWARGGFMSFAIMVKERTPARRESADDVRQGT